MLNRVRISVGTYSDPSGDRGERAPPAQHRDQVITALVTAPIRHRSEPSWQVKACDRGGAPVGLSLEARGGTGERCRVGLGDGRMNQQRSSGSNEKSVKGPLVTTRASFAHRCDTPKITDLAQQGRSPRQMIFERPWSELGLDADLVPRLSGPSSILPHYLIKAPTAVGSVPPGQRDCGPTTG